jgi:hypothetical protein
MNPKTILVRSRAVWAAMLAGLFVSKKRSPVVDRSPLPSVPRPHTGHRPPQAISRNARRIAKARAARIAARSKEQPHGIVPSAARRAELDIETFLPESRMYFERAPEVASARVDFEDAMMGGDFGGAGASGSWDSSSDLNTDCTGSSGSE